MRDRDLIFSRIGLSARFFGGLPSFSQPQQTKNNGGYGTSNGEGGQNSRQQPIESLYALVVAIFGVPAFFAGLFQFNIWLTMSGFIFGSAGLGWFLADWLSGSAVFL